MDIGVLFNDPGPEISIRCPKCKCDEIRYKPHLIPEAKRSHFHPKWQCGHCHCTDCDELCRVTVPSDVAWRLLFGEG